jgi:hypothetical protein
MKFKTQVKKVLIFSLLTILNLPILATPTFTGGTGTQGNPFQLSTSTDLISLSTWVNTGHKCSGQYFIITNDIDMLNISFTPIGKSNSKYFSGYIDGQYHVIKNLTITGTNYIGLFGYIDISNWNIPYPYVKNLGVINSNFTGSSYIGAIIGYCRLSVMSGCFSVNCSLTGTTSIGGLIGEINNTSSNTEVITQCYTNNDIITGTNYIGGIVGHSHVNISKCYSTSILNQNNATAWNMSHTQPISVEDGGTISNCFYLDTWSYNNQAVSYYQHHTNTQPNGTIQTEEQLKNTVQYLVTNNLLFVYDNFNQNNGYPLLRGYIQNKNIIIDNDAVIKTDIDPQPLSITITDKGSLKNTTSQTITATIQNKLYVNHWNLWGPSQTTMTTIGILNNNIGLQHEHDIVASIFNYNTNKWNTTYMLSTDNIECVAGYFIFPLDIWYDITTHTYPNGTAVLNDTTITVSQTGTIIHDNITYNIPETQSAETPLWVAINNPFTYYLDIDKFMTTNSITNTTLYIYDAKNDQWITNNSTSYPYIINTHKVLPKDKGFIINKISNTLNFNYNDLYDDVSAKTSHASNLITFKILSDKYINECYAGITNNCSNDIDNEDAFYLQSTNNTNLISPYFVINNSYILKNIFNIYPSLFNMNISCTTDTNILFEIKDKPEFLKIILLDKLTNSSYILNNDIPISLILNAGNNENRFIIKFDSIHEDTGLDNTDTLEYTIIDIQDDVYHTITSTINLNSAKLTLNSLDGKILYNYIMNGKTLKISKESIPTGIFYLTLYDIKNNKQKLLKIINIK